MRTLKPVWFRAAALLAAFALGWCQTPLLLGQVAKATPAFSNLLLRSNLGGAAPASLPGAYPLVPGLLDPNQRVGNYFVTLTNGIQGECPSITLSPATPALADGMVGVPYSQSLTATGGLGACVFSITSGNLPEGLSLSAGGALSGAPAEPGTNLFTVTATDTNGCTGSQAYTLTVDAPPPDNNSPVLTFCGPNPLVVTNPALLVRGTAIDDVAVATVLYQLNGSAWTPALTTNGWTNWTACVTLCPGTNLLNLYSVDTSSNRSPVQPWVLVYLPLAPLTVQVQGQGQVTPDLNAQWLAIGQTYTVTAVPGVGFVFSNWSGSISAETPTLTFVMQSNLVLQANFVPGHFQPLNATYSGLFYEPGAVALASSGAFTLSTTLSRHFSGTLWLAGARHAFTGWLDHIGTARVSLPAHAPGGLTLWLEVDLTPGSDRLKGTLSNGIWTAGLLGHRTLFDGQRRLAPQAGRYTLVIPGSDDPATPFGDGYGTVSVNPAGRIRCTGRLADGAQFTQSATVSKDGLWPFYVPLATRGLLLGWLAFTNDVEQALGLEGRLRWLKQTGPGKYYPNGFQVEPLAVGCRWAAPGPGTNVLAFTTGSVLLSGPNLSQPLTNLFALKAQNHVLGLWGNQLKLRFTSSSGAFAGSALDPATQKPISFGGVMLQNLNTGYGCFLRTNQSGQVVVGP